MYRITPNLMTRPLRPCLAWIPIAALTFGVSIDAQTIGSTGPEQQGMVINLDADKDGIANSIDRDIDGDQLDNADTNETDIDGDGIANDEDVDMDGDGVVNLLDDDFDCDGIIDPIDFTDDGGSGVFIDEEHTGYVTDFVFGMLRDLLRFDEYCELKVAVLSISEPRGTWNLKTSDGISVNGVWSYPANRPEDFKPFVADLEDECRIIAQYPNGFITHYSWMPGHPVSFDFATSSEESTGKMTPVYHLHAYFSGFPNAYPERPPEEIRGSHSIMFSGNMRVFDGIGPIVDQQRAIFKIVTDWEKENYPAADR
jgi:hypothetical protein